LQTAFEIAQQLALQSHPVPLNLLLLGKAFLTLDGVTRQLDPGFNAWLETPAYASEVFASEAVVRTWSIQFPWLGPARFLSFRAAHANARGSFRGHDPKKSLCKCKQLVGAFQKSVRCFMQKLSNHPEPLQRRKQRKKHE
jgi:hypothetical protein